MQDFCGEIDQGTVETSHMTTVLFKSALALVHDPDEARALVALALQAASEAPPHSSPLGEAEVFRLLRKAYHSVERSRPRRRMRDALVTALAEGREPARTDEGPLPEGSHEAS